MGGQGSTAPRAGSRRGSTYKQPHPHATHTPPHIALCPRPHHTQQSSGTLLRGQRTKGRRRPRGVCAGGTRPGARTLSGTSAGAAARPVRGRRGPTSPPPRRPHAVHDQDRDHARDTTTHKDMKVQFAGCGGLGGHAGGHGLGWREGEAAPLCPAAPTLRRLTRAAHPRPTGEELRVRNSARLVRPLAPGALGATRAMATLACAAHAAMPPTLACCAGLRGYGRGVVSPHAHFPRTSATWHATMPGATAAPFCGGFSMRAAQL